VRDPPGRPIDRSLHTPEISAKAQTRDVSRRDRVPTHQGSPRPGLDEDPAVLVVGDFDAHLGVGGGLVGRVGLGEGGGDVAECRRRPPVL
jgi:hypothetical protein